jgi:membrane-associated phospholipid phosphatase
MVARAVTNRLRAVGLPLLVALAVLTVGAWAFGALAEEMAEGDTVHVDRPVANWLHERATDPLTEVLRVFTWSGNGGFLALVVLVGALVLWRRGLVTDALFLMLAFVGAEVITYGMKQGFRRERPFFEDPLATASSFSFPSGHSLVSLAVYGSIALVAARHVSSRRAAAAVLIAGGAWVLAIGFSRLYLGVHYLSDVLAGYAAGAAWLALLYLALEAGSRYTSRYRASTNEYRPKEKSPAAVRPSRNGPYDA